MNTILIIIIGITAAFTYYGFQNPHIFEKYKFNVGAIKYNKEYIRMLSAGFLHADWMHFFFNMLALYFFTGTVINGAFTSFGMVEGFGVAGFLIIYFGSMLLGNLFSYYLYNNQSWYSAIGASGGVSGVLFAAVALAPKDIEVNFLPGYLFGALYFGYSVYSMLNPRENDNTGHAAHLGGAVFGLIYAVALRPEASMQNFIFLLIMSTPLLYMAYVVFVQKKIR